MWRINASSGPSGENPTGTLELAFPVGATFPVTCLQVTGNRAVIGGHRIFTTADVWAYLIVVDEPGEVPDRVLSALFIDDPLAPATCAEYDARTPNEPGELCPGCGRVVVIDAEPVPTSKDQCNNGGWRNFGSTFKNQGQCVAFVQRGPKP